MKLVRSLAFLTFISILSFGARAADVSGKWTSTFETQVGKQTYTYEFEVKGSTLVGKATSANGTTAIEQGTVNGDTISFVEKLKFEDRSLTITYTGKVVSDDEIQFKREIAGFGGESLTAKRVK